MYYRSDARSSGFTIIELLVVITIIGLLASVVIAALGTSRAKSRDARRLQDLRAMASVIELQRTGIAAYSFVGCAAADARASTCTTPALGMYRDPSNSTTACTNVSTGVCDYSVSQAGGGAAATVDNYQICSYLEVGVNSLPAGLVSVRSTGSGTAVTGCN